MNTSRIPHRRKKPVPPTLQHPWRGVVHPWRASSLTWEHDFEPAPWASDYDDREAIRYHLRGWRFDD